MIGTEQGSVTNGWNELFREGGLVCPSCSSIATDYGFTPYGEHYQSCDGCGNLLCWQWRSTNEYLAWYVDGRYHTTEQRENGQLPYGTPERAEIATELAQKRYKLLNALGVIDESVRLVDIGAGTDSFAMVVEREQPGCLVYSCEPCEKLANIKPKHRKQWRIGGSLGWEGIPKEKRFDVITAFDVIEHLTRPKAFVRQCQTWLSPGGFLVVETPEVEGVDHYQKGEQWKHLRPRQHICLYTKTGLETLVASECGDLELIAYIQCALGAVGKSLFVWRKVDKGPINEKS